jgi:hypothetical protein
MQYEKHQNNQNIQLINYKIKRLQYNKEEVETIFNYDKELFYNLNFLVNVPTNIEDKLQELNYNFSLFSEGKFGKRKTDLRFFEKDILKHVESNKQFSISNLFIIQPFQPILRKISKCLNKVQKTCHMLIIHIPKFRLFSTHRLIKKSYL